MVANQLERSNVDPIGFAVVVTIVGFVSWLGAAAQPNSWLYPVGPVVDRATGDAVADLPERRVIFRGYDASTAISEGPIEIDAGDGKGDADSCTIEVSLVTDVFVDQNGRQALIFSSSGSTTYVQGFSLFDCTSLWPEIDVSGGSVSVIDHRIEIEPACLATEDPSIVRCWSQRRFIVDDAFTLSPAPIASRNETKKALGAAFYGIACIRGKGGPEATVVPCPVVEPAYSSSGKVSD